MRRGRDLNTPSPQRTKDPGPDEKATVGNLKDPVCGMAVTMASTYQAVHDSTTYYFCSARCASKFAADPIAHLGKQPTAKVTGVPATVTVAASTYICPMHPEIRQSHPGNCPQ